MKRTAVFLDRDGTIIEDAGYLGDPQKVRLIRDAADAIRRFRQAGCLVVIVSNQSGVARGFFDEVALYKVHAHLESLLAEKGAATDQAYYCPYLDGPEAIVVAYRRDSDLRKPRPGMLLRAAKELDIDLSRSWMIGDSSTDVQAGISAGCRTILLRHNGALPPAVDVAPTHCVDSMTEAAVLVEQAMKQELSPSPFMGEGRGEGKTSDALAHNPPSPSQGADRTGGQSSPSPLKGEGGGEGETPNDAVLLSLEKIHNQLERAHRKDRQHDFSFLRLLGALLQMLAIVAALWGVVALLDDRSALATARLTLACFFQFAAITAFAIDRFR